MRILVLASVAAVVGISTGFGFFFSDSREIVLAGHDATISPRPDHHAVLSTGPLLPDLRLSIDSPVGVSIDLGATEVGSAEQLVERYAFIATEPEVQVTKITDEMISMAIAAALRGLGFGLMPVALYLLLGHTRRRELLRKTRRPLGALAGVTALSLPLLVWQPWSGDEVPPATVGEWVPLEAFLGGAIPLPEGFDAVEIREGTATDQTKRLVLSAVDTYEKSKSFYDAAAEAAADLELRAPEPDEEVALLVSDRHDNIGMDPVARAVADAAGASIILDAGDDTSTGQPWEAFSLDSLVAVFDDFERYAVAGNHDNGTFVRDFLVDAGWTMPQGEVVEGPDGGTLLAIDDPRASGLGNWRDTSGTSFADVEELIAETACASDVRINTILVHDANLGRTALAQGCADLVVGGHTHVQEGPTLVEGPEGQVGYSLTNGTTGGAAYAIAVGSKPRRSAHVNLITYSSGRPVGVQTVELQTNGSFVVSDYVPLDPGEEPGVILASGVDVRR